MKKRVKPNKEKENNLINQSKNKAKEKANVQKAKRRTKRTPQNKQMLFLFGGVALAIVLMSVVFVMKTSSNYQLHADAYQVYAGSQVDYPSKTKFVYKELGPALRDAKEGEYLASSPIYYKEEALAMLPSAMVHVNPRTQEMLQLPAFSELSLSSGKVFYEDQALAGFLFDGNGTYVFLEPVVISTVSKNYELAPLSMIMIASNHTYCLYSYDTKQMVFEESSADTLFAKGDNFQIELQGDVLYGKNNERILLFDKPELLDPIE